LFLKHTREWTRVGNWKGSGADRRPVRYPQPESIRVILLGRGVRYPSVSHMGTMVIKKSCRRPGKKEKDTWEGEHVKGYIDEQGDSFSPGEVTLDVNI